MTINYKLHLHHFIRQDNSLFTLFMHISLPYRTWLRSRNRKPLCRPDICKPDKFGTFVEKLSVSHLQRNDGPAKYVLSTRKKKHLNLTHIINLTYVTALHRSLAYCYRIDTSEINSHLLTVWKYI